MNKKIIILLVSFVLMVPFRLPISVLFIDLITNIANMTGNLTDAILVSNVIVTKIIYDLALAFLAVYNLEMLLRGRSREVKNLNGGLSIEQITEYNRTVDTWKRKEYNFPKRADSVDFSGWSALAVCMYAVYIIFDSITTYDLFFVIKN